MSLGQFLLGDNEGAGRDGSGFFFFEFPVYCLLSVSVFGSEIITITFPVAPAILTAHCTALDPAQVIICAIKGPMSVSLPGLCASKDGVHVCLCI